MKSGHKVATPFEAKYLITKLLIKKRENTDLKQFNYSKDFIEYSNNVYKNIEGYNSNKKCKILIVFDDAIADKFSNKKLFIRDRKLKIPLFYHAILHNLIPKNIRLNSTHYFIMKIPNKREL